MKVLSVKCLYFVALLWVIVVVPVTAQDKYTQLQEDLNKLAATDIPQLNERVNISVANSPIQDFLRGVASNTGLNINVDPSLQISVANNFSNVKVTDVLLFLARQYNLSVTVIGNIVNISKEEYKPMVQSRKVTVRSDNSTGNITIECENDDLINFAKDFAAATGLNLVPAPGLDRQKVGGFINNMPIDNALEKFAYTNNLTIRKSEDGIYIIERVERPDISQQSQQKQNTANKGNKRQGAQTGDGPQDFKMEAINRDSISVSAVETPLTEIIKGAAELLKLDYYFTSQLQGNSTITLKGTNFEQLLNVLFKGTSYSYQKIAGIFLIGDSKNGDLKDFKIIQLQNRTIEKISEVLPKDLIKDVEIKEFPEINSIYVSGTPDKVDKLVSLINALDKVIPVILIEVMIVDTKNSTSLSTGIKLGLGNEPVKTSGTVFPSVNMDLSSQSINELINSFNGFGAFKIGKVTPNFYMNLQALEDNGFIDIQSTPKLSTLNGHEATLSIGNTQYYREQSSNYYGSISSQMSTIEVFKPVTAELMVKIKPFVSGDDQITLEIEVIQGDFTDRISQYAPPGQVKREFKSQIRIKNQEMVLLGGLEEKRKNDAGTGVPILSRIPIIKWFFSSRTKADSKSKLNIFIKPTLIN